MVRLLGVMFDELGRLKKWVKKCVLGERYVKLVFSPTKHKILSREIHNKY